MKLQLNRIVLDEKLRARASGLNPLAVHRLVEAYGAGARFPPLIVEKGTHRLVDGWTRHAAYQLLGLKQIDVEIRSYHDETELFADAVRFNIQHGQPFTGYDIKHAIARLEKLGLGHSAISELVRMSIPKIEDIVRGFGHSATGEAIPLKRGVEYLHGQQISELQVKAMRRLGGVATFHARQLVLRLEQDLWPHDNGNFREAMDQLCALWLARSKSAAA
ncbi:MAG TPA: hypothetical protein VLN57_07485 [Xanthobacteraceae bacterium]|nr:hypothetical protein [Xanthobacteraceae bacterium]